MNNLTEIKVIVLGITGIIFLELFALYQGVDGQMFSVATMAVGGIVGYMVKEYHHRHKEPEKRKRR